MAIIKKFAENLTQPLTSFGTFLVDTNPNSTYFKITEFKDTFTGGKNGFLIEGSEHLMESTEIKIQILDVNGNPIYYEPGNGVPEYYEGTSKLVAVYVYEDTPIGTAKITILGELKTYIDEGGVVQQIPDEWKSVYNVKWEKEFKVNRLLSNEDNVRFYRRPEVSINEIVKPIFSNIVTPITQMGRVDGFAQVPAQGERLAGYSLPTNYLLQIKDGGAWTGSVVGTTIELTDLGLFTLADDVISKTDLTVQTPYTINGIVQNFSNQRYTASFNYVEGLDNLKTALTGSFAKITISDLTTFVGDVARVKIFRKSQSDLADYQFIQEIQLESNEILRDLESTTKNEEFYGSFDNINYKNYWVTSSNNLTTSFNQSYLYNSVKLDSIGVNKFFTTQSIQITKDTEYTISFNVRLGNQTLSSDDYISVYISGSRESTIGNVTNSVGVQQNILTVTEDSSIFQKSQITANFKGEDFTDAKLYFDVKGSDWYISDISLRASQESSFSPDEITFIQPIPRTLPKETFNFLFQFYDINNNYIPVVVEESKTFDGGNLNRINKSLELIPSSLYFQFDSGSGNGNPVPPNVIFIDVVKQFLTGSVTFTSRSFDFFNNELSSSQYSYTETPGYDWWQFPGLLNDINTDKPFLTVQNFTGSRDPLLEDIVVQFIEYTGECEGVSDSIIITRVIDGKGGVNYEIRPYDGTVIRNSDPSSSLEVQAIRIDGVNEIDLRSGLPAGRSNIKLHVQSGSKYITLSEASSSGWVKSLKPGVTGSGEIDYNAVFNRDSIEGQITLYMLPVSQSNQSGSILTTLTLTDLQDGLDAGVVLYDADTFTINPRLETTFTPIFSSATASFFRRGTFEAPISCSIEVYPSMSINKDFVPEYWVQYVTHSCNPDISVIAYDEFGNIIPSRTNAATYTLGDPLVQSKQLLVNFVYTEPWTSASVSVDKLFTIVPEGKPGDESIIFEVTPASVTLSANSRGDVNDYKPSITDIKLKQGSRYLSFTGSREPGTFHIAQSSITASNITGGLVYFDNAYTESLIVSASSGFINLSGSITYPLEIQPYYTSSVYTASVVQQYTKVLEGAPPIQILITPQNATLTADEVGFITPVGYSPTNTTIQVKEGEDFLRFTTQSAQPGTWRINSIETRGGSIWNIRTGSLSSASLSTATISYNRFDYPYVSASALYTIQVYPFALGSGHEYTSSIYTRTQTFTKNVSVPNARSVELKANPYTINYDRDGYRVSPEGDVELKATALNTTGSAWFSLFFIDTDGSETLYDGPYFEGAGITEKVFFIPGTDAAGPEENKTWRVKITDGNPYTSSLVNPYRAEGQLTIAGIKAGSDAYKISADNVSTSVKAELFNTDTSGTAIKLPTYKGATPLINVTSGNYPAPQPTDYDYLENLIGILGYSSASIVYKSPWIGLSTNRVTTTPASMPNIASWDKPAINKTGEIVYKVDFEGYSNQVTTNFINRPPSRQTEFVTQSFAVQFTEPAPYDVKLGNENSSVVYRVSGEVELDGTSNIIRAYRGGYELTNKPTGFTGVKTDAYGSSSYEYQCTIEITSKSSHITLGGGLIVGSKVTGTPATMPGVTAWSSPETNPTAEIVYGINCEGRQTIFKTQSLSVQYEGAVGPGIVMRGEWSPSIDYIGSVETTNNRRDAVTYLATQDSVKYYAAISGSGPNTYNGASVLVGAQAPTPNGTNAYWEYLGDQEFFVAAKIAIFEESYVKNTINVGTKDGTGAFANIVLAGGRPDPYIAIGQTGTQGTAGTSGTSNPAAGIIGYDRPGIFLGVYEDGTNGTTGRFSIKSAGGSGTRGMFWDGDTLTIVGSIRQVSPGVSEGSLRGAWTAGFTYFANDIVSYQGQSWQCTSATSHVATNNTNSTTGYPGSGPWSLAAAAGTSGMDGAAGADGAPGPGVVYRGPFTAGTQYFRETTRRDVVQGTNGQYYLCKVTYTPSDNSTRPVDGASYTTYWESFGATFSSVATNVLLAQDATITRGLVMGTQDGIGGFIRSANASSITTGEGFYLETDGRVRFGNTVAPNNNYIYWNNATLEISGVLTATQGVIGGWQITPSGLDYVSTDGNKRINLNSERGALEIFYSGSLLVDINSNTALTDITSVSALWPSSGVPFQPAGSIPGDGTFVYGSVHPDTVVLTAGKTYEFSWGTGYIPTITNTGEFVSYGFGLMLSTNSTPVQSNSTIFLNTGGYRSGPGVAQLQSFTTVFTATSSGTYYIRPYINGYSSTTVYDPFTPPYYTYEYTPFYLDADLYYYGAEIKPSIEKTEIVGGGIQVVRDSTTFFKVDRNAASFQPFIKGTGGKVLFEGTSTGMENSFEVRNYQSTVIYGGNAYITMDDSTYMGIYPSLGIRISPSAVGAASGAGFVQLEPGSGAYAVVGNNPATAGQRIVVGSGGPSDERLKTEIEEVEDGSLEKINQLKIKYFKFKENGRDGDGIGNKKVGVIAQEVLKTDIDYLVNQNWPDDDGDYNVDHFSILGHAIKAIQELSKKVSELEAQISGSL